MVKKGEIPEGVYPTTETHSGHCIGFPNDSWFINVWCSRPFTWTADADGKITIALAGNAGSYTATVDSSGQMTIEAPDGFQGSAYPVTKTSGDYSSLKYAV